MRVDNHDPTTFTATHKFVAPLGGDLTAWIEVSHGEQVLETVQMPLGDTAALDKTARYITRAYTDPMVEKTKGDTTSWEDRTNLDDILVYKALAAARKAALREYREPFAHWTNASEDPAQKPEHFLWLNRIQVPRNAGSLLFGPPESGKSTMAAHLAVKMAEHDPERGVGFIDLETDGGTRQKAVAHGMKGAPANLYFPQRRPTDIASVVYECWLARKARKIDYVVVDSAGLAVADDLNSVTAPARLADALRSIGYSGYMLLAHQPKADGKFIAADFTTAVGSYGFMAIPRLVIHCGPKPPSKKAEKKAIPLTEAYAAERTSILTVTKSNDTGQRGDAPVEVTMLFGRKGGITVKHGVVPEGERWKPDRLLSNEERGQLLMAALLGNKSMQNSRVQRAMKLTKNADAEAIASRVLKSLEDGKLIVMTRRGGGLSWSLTPKGIKEAEAANAE